MGKNKYIYYGILFYFLYIQIYGIISRVLTWPVLSMQWNVHLVLILPLLLIIVLSVLFYRLKEFPKIRLWFILLVIFLSVVITFFDIPNIYYMSAYSVYSFEEKSIITNYIQTCRAVNTIVFLAIAYFKYLKVQD